MLMKIISDRKENVTRTLDFLIKRFEINKRIKNSRQKQNK